MARSIVLRFAATCFDCGSSLSAGSTARWFGRGRVSCCGNPSTKPGDFSPAAVPSDPPRARPAGSAPAPYPVTYAAARMQPHVPLSPIEQLSVDTGIPLENLSAGLNPAQLAKLAGSHPHQRLCVRLQSGARFIVTAQHAAHVIRCLEESCIDRVRDVALLADKHGEGGS